VPPSQSSAVNVVFVGIVILKESKMMVYSKEYGVHERKREKKHDTRNAVARPRIASLLLTSCIAVSPF
jgi:hypothetical protein